MFEFIGWGVVDVDEMTTFFCSFVVVIICWDDDVNEISTFMLVLVVFVIIKDVFDIGKFSKFGVNTVVTVLKKYK